MRSQRRGIWSTRSLGREQGLEVRQMGPCWGRAGSPGWGGGAKVQQGFAEARDHRELCVKGGALWVL